MPVRVTCPHCRTPCLVAEQHRGVPVKCGRCARTFTTRADPAATTRIDPAAAPPAPVRLDVGAATSPGRVRQRNEDSFLVQQLVCCNLDAWRELVVVVVADGMGGAAAGDRASGLVIRGAAAALAPLVGNVLNGTNKDAAGAADAITAALREANRVVWSTARQDAACKGMGATAALAVICAGQAYIGHVGDCRVYHQRGSRLRLSGGNAKPQAAVGMSAQLDPASYQLRLAVGDWLLLACDGLHAHLDDALLQSAIAAATPSAVHLAQRLVERADELGGSDNCTVVAVRCY